jgi:hypothetical protein
MLEWLYQEETMLAWLESLDGLLDREERLEDALASAGWTVREGAEPSLDKTGRQLVVAALPAPGRSLKRDLPCIWGGDAFPDDHGPLPADLCGLRSWLVGELQRAVGLGWSNYAEHTVVLAELGEAFGEEMVHAGLSVRLDALRRKLLELYEALQRFGSFPLPKPDPDNIDKLRSWVRWEYIRPESTSPSTLLTTGRGWMRSEELAELEALETRLAEELRSRGPARRVDFTCERSE